MEAAVTLKMLKDRMLELRQQGMNSYLNDKFGIDFTMWGTSIAASLKLSAEQRDEWRYTAAQLLKRSRQADEKLVQCPHGTDMSEIVCEACLETKTCIVVGVEGTGGVVSRHPQGDWLCGDCDPRVEALINFHGLCRLTGVE